MIQKIARLLERPRLALNITFHPYYMPAIPIASSFGRFSPVHFRISTDALYRTLGHPSVNLSRSTEIRPKFPQRLPWGIPLCALFCYQKIQARISLALKEKVLAQHLWFPPSWAGTANKHERDTNAKFDKLVRRKSVLLRLQKAYNPPPRKGFGQL